MRNRVLRRWSDPSLNLCAALILPMLFASSCDRSGKSSDLSAADAAKAGDVNRPAAVTKDVPDCVAEANGRDSAAAVELAARRLRHRGEPGPLVLSRSIRHEEGLLLTLVPQQTDTLVTFGGGGLVWVGHDGCTAVLKLHE